MESGEHKKGIWDRMLARHPWLLPLACLGCALANAYEAVYIRPESLWSIVDGAFALVGLLGFFASLVFVVSGYLSKTD